jgi:protocatechuate 3,4-dioxygenase beta subunit
VETPLGEANTDAAGAFAIAAEPLALSRIARGIASVKLTADAPLHHRGEAEAPLPSGDETSVDVVVEPGGTVAGRVVDAAGAPVAGAYAEVYGAAGFGYTDAGGGYRIAVREAGLRHVVATAPARGAGSVGPLDLSPQRDVVAPDVFLGGTGSIDGVVVLADGTPLARVDVVARHETDADGRRPAPEEAPRGLAVACVMTDAGGAFRFDGLRPGRFRLTASEALQFDGEEIHPLGARVRLVARTSLLRVRVEDEGGAALPGVSLSVEQDRSLQATTTFGERGAAEVAVEPGRCVVEAALAGVLPARQEVTVPQVPRVIDVTLVLREAQTGRIRLGLRGDDGTEIRGFRVTLVTDPEGTTVLYGVAPDEGGLLPAVPLGRYVAEVEPDPRDLWLPATAPVIVGEQESQVEVRTTRGGRLRITVTGAVVLKSFDASVRPAQGEPGDAVSLSGGIDLPDEMLAELPSRMADLAALRPFLYDKPGGGYVLTGRIEPGVPAPCRRVLRPGPYVVEASVEGLAPLRVPADVRAGEVTDVALAFQR